MRNKKGPDGAFFIAARQTTCAGHATKSEIQTAMTSIPPRYGRSASGT
jgi:hypothetical protein